METLKKGKITNEVLIRKEENANESKNIWLTKVKERPEKM